MFQGDCKFVTFIQDGLFLIVKIYSDFKCFICLYEFTASFKVSVNFLLNGIRYILVKI